MVKRPSVDVGRRSEVEIHDLGHQGEGVGRLGDFVVFVPGAIPGDRVLVEIAEHKGRFGHAKLIEVLEASPDRVKPPCAAFGQCGGCQLQHMSYEAQLRWKQKRVADALARVGRLPNVKVHPVLGQAYPFAYRNKAQYPIARQGQQTIMGFYRPGSHEIVDLDGCLIQDPLIAHLANAVRQVVAEVGIEPYDEVVGTGVLRHVVFRASRWTGEVMVVLVANTEHVPRLPEIVSRLQAASGRLASIYLNVNSKKTNVIFGTRFKLLWGSRALVDRIGRFSFRISPASFFQVNGEQVERLYECVLDYAQLTGCEHVFDAYCGIGTIALYLSQKAASVVGVEIVPEAVWDARENASLNGVTNVAFYAGEAEQVIPDLLRKGFRFDLGVVDPPRKGCGEALLQAMGTWGLRRLVYVSCNPSTFARDAAILRNHGFTLNEVQPVDMFPQTAHVECVGRFERTPL